MIETQDPLEPLNRRVYDFNVGFRTTVVEPAARVARGPVVAPVVTATSNVLQNLSAPLIFVNDVAQGRPCAAAITVGRFMVNSTIGLGGLFDVAGMRPGFAGHDNSFAQTLNVWGLPAGPYVMLPISGPTNVRGLVSKVVETRIDPLDYAFVGANVRQLNWARTAAESTVGQLQLAPDLAKLEATSLDGYAALRSAYSQSEVQAPKPPECPEADSAADEDPWRNVFQGGN